MHRSVLITGATSGIGASAALHLARLGFHVVATGRTDEGVEHLAAAARAEGVDLEVLTLDVTDAAACARALEGRELFALVNNAGYFNAGAIEDVPLADARRQLETMVLAPMHLAQLAIPPMRARGEGRIVNISSALTLASGALAGWYQASKQALEGASDALRLEVAQDGIEVVLIRPGAVRTPIWDKTATDLRRRRVGSAHAAGYDRALDFIRFLEGHMHTEAEVAALIGEALTTGRPRPVYRLGHDTTVLARANMLPLPVKDLLVRTALRM